MKKQNAQFSTTDAILAMENIVEKLKWLDYEIHFIHRFQLKPVSRYEFIVPAPNTALQFHHYVELVKWLISIVQGHECDLDPFDDPNIIAQKMLEVDPTTMLGTMNLELF